MLQNLLAALRGKKNTTAVVMTAFSKTLSELRQVESEHEKQAAEAAISAQQAQAEHAAAKQEAATAAAVAARLESLISTSAAAAEGFADIRPAAV